MPTEARYDGDFLIWTERQAEELRRAATERSNLPLDWDNLAEEIESLGQSQRSQARNVIHQIIAHLVKLAYSPAKLNWFAWETEIGMFRRQLHQTIEDSASLKPGLPGMVEREIKPAIRSAIYSLRKYEELEAIAMIEKTTLAFTVEQILDDEWFLPGTYERMLAERDRRP